MCDRHGRPLGAAIQSLFGAPAAPGPTPDCLAATPPAKPVRRLKLWELEEKYHCPVVGTCLSLEEIKKIARKGGFEGRTFDEYRLHVEAVSISCSRNPVAEAMHKRLDRKYDLYLRRFEQAREESELRAMWKQHLDQGEVAGAMWAALTHRASSPESRHVVYADVHMLSHQIGAGQAADLRRLEWLEREHAEQSRLRRQETERLNRELATRAERIRELEQATAETWQRAQAASPLRARVEALENGVAMTDMARRLLLTRDESARYQARCGELEQCLEAMASRLTQVEAQLEVASQERDALERLWSQSGTLAERGAGQGGSCDGACDVCPGNLRGRCVLCVGGRTPLLPQYRQLAERLGVRLIHHDGGREEALSRLPALLASSDAVICPTDCVGHMAYYQLKQHCKLSNKPCVLVKSSGVASFAAALTRLAEGQAEIKPEYP